MDHRVHVPILKAVPAADCHLYHLFPCCFRAMTAHGRCAQMATAMQSISTRAPFGRAETSTQALAGDTPAPKVSA